jgi:hypothetical protein
LALSIRARAVAALRSAAKPRFSCRTRLSRRKPITDWPIPSTSTGRSAAARAAARRTRIVLNDPRVGATI